MKLDAEVQVIKEARKDLVAQLKKVKGDLDITTKDLDIAKGSYTQAIKNVQERWAQAAKEWGKCSCFPPARCMCLLLFVIIPPTCMCVLLYRQLRRWTR